MKVIIDCSSKDIFLSVVKDDKTISYKWIKNLITKSDFLPTLFSELLTESNISINQIKSFYITIGPGTFMGIRASLIFARTISQIKNIDLHIANSFVLCKVNNENIYYIDASSHESFKYAPGISQEITIVEKQKNSEYDYESLILTPSKFLEKFSRVTNLLELNPLYIKEPLVGGK